MKILAVTRTCVRAVCEGEGEFFHANGGNMNELIIQTGDTLKGVGQALDFFHAVAEDAEEETYSATIHHKGKNLQLEKEGETYFVDGEELEVHSSVRGALIRTIAMKTR